MENPFVGEIALVGFNFAPVGWALCNGQLLAINQNTALFSLLGTMYGGDGVTTFALPDLRGRVPLHMGQGPGLSNRTIGEAAGAESSTLTPAQMPAHTHQAMSTSFNGVTDSPVGNVPARDAAGTPIYGTVPNAPMHAGAIQSTGGSQPHDNMQPFLAINYIISLVGIYPSRS
jgi:microcystin-dependent protein